MLRGWMRDLVIGVCPSPVEGLKHDVFVVAIATTLALLTALFYAISNVLELLEAEKVPDEYSMRPGLVVRLAQRPRWLLGLLADFGGYLCHAAALGLATVVFVEPILALGILLSLFIGSRFVHRPVLRADWIAAGVLSGGLALFLYEVSPTGGSQLAHTREWVIAGPSAMAAIALCLIFGRAATGRPRAALLGVAAGIAFGVSALLTKALVHYLGNGIFAWVTHWEPYALAVAAIGGVIVAQSALQTGALGAAVGSIESMSVISGSLFGLFLLNERVGVHSAFQLAAVVVSIAAIIGGILRLSHAEGRVLGAATGSSGAADDYGISGEFGTPGESPAPA